MEGNKVEKVGVPIQEVVDSPENEATIALVIKLRDLSHRLAIDKYDQKLMNEISIFADGLIQRHKDSYLKCRLYHVLGGSGRVKSNVQDGFFDFEGDDSIAKFCAEKLREIENQT